MELTCSPKDQNKINILNGAVTCNNLSNIHLEELNIYIRYWPIFIIFFENW